MKTYYLTQRKIKDKWCNVGEFDVGSKWRDERPVNDETMTLELAYYRERYPNHIARVEKPDGTFIE